MGSLVEAEDEDEYAICLAKSTMNEKLPNSPQFDTDDYTRVTVAAAQTADLVVSGADDDYALYKLTISAAAAQVVDVFWTDSANANVLNLLEKFLLLMREHGFMTLILHF